MHIEPGIVEGAKLVLGYATASAAAIYGGRECARQISADGIAPFLGRCAVTTTIVLALFELLPHPPVGVSEVHLILGSTLFLLFGAGAAAVGLAGGLLIQGLAFAPVDLPQFGMNVTTLLVPLFALAAVSRRIVAAGTPYVDLNYRQVLKMSATYQGGIVAWVAFWASYGQGAAAFTSVATFAVAYLGVLLIEPFIDLAVLRAAKAFHAGGGTGAFAALFQRRLLRAA